MAFPGRELDDGENKKQHLNLSALAYDVVQNDWNAFGAATRSAFINRIFKYYSPLAEASISRMLNQRQGELERLLAGIGGDESTKRLVIKALLKEETARLIENTKSYGKGAVLKIWLNKENVDYLTAPESECREETYYGERRGNYIKCVVEEYARLPYMQRERIYFSPFLQEIETALQRECQLRVKTGKETVYSVYPYRVCHDPLATANYLIGFSRRYSCPGESLRPCSFRISALASVKAEKSKSAFLKQDRRKELEQLMAGRGVQFLPTEEKEIRVRLTEAGRVKYKRQVHLRPKHIREEGDIFVFQCTEAQAQFYFFKFGEDAEILQPEALRRKFKALYERAAFVYEGE